MRADMLPRYSRPVNKVFKQFVLVKVMSGKGNNEILTLKERVLNSINLGESHFREFKSAFEGPADRKRRRKVSSICRDIGDSLVAFANADGGELLIGVEDDGTITGISHNRKDVSAMIQASTSHVHKETPLPKPMVSRLIIDGKTVLYFSIEKGTQYYYLTSDGKCLQRSDRDTVPRSVEQIQFDRGERASREYDRAFVDGAATTDLDQNILRNVVERISPGVSPEKLLQYLGLADYSKGFMRLRRATLLLSASDASRWHPRCEVRVIKVRGNEIKTGREYNVVSDVIKRGNIISLLRDSWDAIRLHLVETRLSEDGLFEERILYPEDACREALINAIAHRDYSIEGEGIEIKIFDNRMEIQSPGALLSTIYVEDLRRLKGVHESRNAFVTRTLRELGYMREMGEGIRRIFFLVKRNDQMRPSLESSKKHFTITLFHRSIFSNSDELWLNTYQDFDLGREERLILLLGRGGERISPQSIIDALDIIDTDQYRALIYQLQLKGIIYPLFSRSSITWKARKRGISRREVRRYVVRDASECKRHFSILLKGLQELGSFDVFSTSVYNRLHQILPPDNIYDRSHSQLVNTLRLFNLIEHNKKPTPRLESILQSGVKLYEGGPTRFKPVKLKPPRDIATEGKKLRYPESPRVYIGNLDSSTTREEIETLFSEYGEVIRVTIPTDYATGKARGFGFVLMDSFKEAEVAIRFLNGTIFKGRKITLDWSHSRGRAGGAT